MATAIGNYHLVGFRKLDNLIGPYVCMPKSAVDQQYGFTRAINRIKHFNAVHRCITTLSSRRHGGRFRYRHPSILRNSRRAKNKKSQNSKKCFDLVHFLTPLDPQIKYLNIEYAQRQTAEIIPAAWNLKSEAD